MNLDLGGASSQEQFWLSKLPSSCMHHTVQYLLYCSITVKALWWTCFFGGEEGMLSIRYICTP